jgi:hypothetical protein
MRAMNKAFLIPLLAVWDSACGLRRQAHHTANPRLEHVASTTSVAVAVQDRRKEVVTGDKEANFVGLLRSGFGISVRRDHQERRTVLSEPIHAPDPAQAHANRDAGWLLVPVYEQRRAASSLAVFRAGAIEEGPIAAIRLEDHDPWAFHGYWEGAAAAG